MTEKAEIIRTPNSVFVSVQPPEKLQQAIAAEAQPRVWAKVATAIASELQTPEPTPQSATAPPILTPDALVDIIEKMTALDIQDGAQTGGWHCEDAIFKVTRINLRIDVSAPTLRAMLFGLVKKGTLEHKRAYGLDKFRLSVALTEVAGDAVGVSEFGLNS